MGVEIQRVADIIRQVAMEEVLPRFGALTRHEVRQKAPGDLVTLADMEAERRLTALLPALLPGSRVIGEEAAAEDPGILALLSTDDPIWVVDPVDGTWNFAHGNCNFAVMVGLVRHRRAVAGWIFDPVADRMAMAEEGSGTVMDGRPVTLESPAELGDMLGFLSVGRLSESYRRVLKADVEAKLGGQQSLRCAGHEYLRLLDGRGHFSFYHTVKPWDHVPGAALIGEAGGVVAHHDGSAYVPTNQQGGLLVAPCWNSWKELEAVLLASKPR